MDNRSPTQETSALNASARYHANVNLSPPPGPSLQSTHCFTSGRAARCDVREPRVHHLSVLTRSPTHVAVLSAMVNDSHSS